MEPDEVITLLELENEEDLNTALAFFDDVPFMVGDEHAIDDHDEVVDWMMEAQVSLVLTSHYLQMEGPSAFLADQLKSIARQAWLASMRVASMTPDLKEAQRNNPNGVA